MAVVKPFRALRPLPEQVAATASVPYDVVNTEEARSLAADNKLSFLRVSRPEIEMPEGTDIYSDEVYAKAAQNFERLTAEAPLIVEDTPSFYFYTLKMAGRVQTGLVACCSVDEYDNDVIRKHERTRKDKEDDRTRHVLTLRAQTGPVFLTYKANQTINELTRALMSAPPLFDFTAPDGIQHTIHKVPIEMNNAIIEAFGEVKNLYIADGHHRAKSASRAREELRSKNSNHSGSEEYNFFQCVIFPSNQLHIMPYNRVVKDLNGRTKNEFLKEISQEFEIKEQASPMPSTPGHFSMYIDGNWVELTPKDGATIHQNGSNGANPVDSLDVSILQNKLLTPVLGIKDVRTDKRIDFVGGIRGTDQLVKLVDSGKSAVAFSMYPVTVDELIAVSDANEIMPPKSTWFEPKLRDGLLSHLI